MPDPMSQKDRTEPKDQCSELHRIGSMCSGYGGLELGLLRAVDGRVVWHVEYDKDPAKILRHHWPEIPNYGDVTSTDWTQVEPIDWLTAGYPCQPFSLAGKRKGTTDERHIWPHVAVAIGVLRPRRVLLENVAGHLSMGFDAVLGDLATLGYDATWCVVRASDAGAPHARARLFVVATESPREQMGSGRFSRSRSGLHVADAESDRRNERWPESARVERGLDASQRGHAATNTGSARLGQYTGAASQEETGAVASDELADHRGSRPAVDWGPYRPAIERWEQVTGRRAPRPTEPRPNGERLSPRFTEWLMGLPDGWVTGCDLSRNAQLKALGNGVVPQQATLAVATLTEMEAAA